MAVVGGNLENLEALGQEFLKDAQYIDAMIPRINRMLAAAQWTGGNASQFTSSWQNQWQPMLRNLANGPDGLTASGNYIRNNKTALAQATGSGQ